MRSSLRLPLLPSLLPCCWQILWLFILARIFFGSGAALRMRSWSPAFSVPVPPKPPSLGKSRSSGDDRGLRRCPDGSSNKPVLGYTQRGYQPFGTVNTVRSGAVERRLLGDGAAAVATALAAASKATQPTQGDTRIKLPSAGVLVYEMLIAGLALFTLALNFAELSIPDALEGNAGDLDKMLKRMILRADTLVCGVFFLDFLVRHVAPIFRGPVRRSGSARRSRLISVLSAAMDLASCVPANTANWGWGGKTWRTMRAAQLFRVFQAVRVAKASSVLMFVLKEARVLSLAAGVAYLSFITWLLGALGVLFFEQRGGSTSIRNEGDALWWAAATMTTVGYGDAVPSTVGGRAIGTILMLIGISVFGVMSGLISSFVLRQAEGQGPELSDAAAQAQQPAAPESPPPSPQVEAGQTRAPGASPEWAQKQGPELSDAASQAQRPTDPESPPPLQVEVWTLRTEVAELRDLSAKMSQQLGSLQDLCGKLQGLRRPAIPEHGKLQPGEEPTGT